MPRAALPRPHSNWKVPPRYEVRSLLGVGSYGHVCEASDNLLKKLVAIKKVPKLFEELIDCKRILREIAILSRLSHENVVGLHDVCIPGDPMQFDELYLVLELADCDLKKLMKTPVFLSELHVVTLLYNILLGVKYIHSQGILHRDLKPANCLVNQDCTAKLCDFGLARTVDSRFDYLLLGGHTYGSNSGPATDQSTSSSGSVTVVEDVQVYTEVLHNRKMKKQLTSHVVTRWYRAPELILLQEKYNEAIDVWSVGCIFAELLGMMKSNVRSYLDRGPIFPGSSCFPLSPDLKHPDQKFCSKGNRDQLNMIFEYLGTPDEEDLRTLEKEDARKYVRLFTPRPRQNFAHKFPGASAEAIDVLTRMLTFNPSKRITVEEALASPLFNNVRDVAAEKTASATTTRVRLPFDDWRMMSENELRYAFLKEGRKYDSMLTIPRALEAVGYRITAPIVLATPPTTSTVVIQQQKQPQLSARHSTANLKSAPTATATTTTTVTTTVVTSSAAPTAGSNYEAVRRLENRRPSGGDGPRRPSN